MPLVCKAIASGNEPERTIRPKDDFRQASERSAGRAVVTEQIYMEDDRWISRADRKIRTSVVDRR